jgi:hypothetical protein
MQPPPLSPCGATTEEIDSMRSIRTIGTLAACGALGLTGTALANSANGHAHGPGPVDTLTHGHWPVEKPSQAHSHGQTVKLRNAVFTATVSSVDSGAGTLTVSVVRGNHWARPYVGKSLVVTTARVNAADTDGDGQAGLSDVMVGDVVRFHSKIATDGAATAITTRRVVDVTRSHD